jgi:ABC-type branched-subunit amino acid transport system substrate-binding protein
MGTTKDPRHDANRRSFMRTSAGLAGSLLIPGLYSSHLLAAENVPEKLGNFPDGVAGDSVFVGLTCDLTGPYSAEGTDERRGYELAIEQINNGDPLARKISPLTKKGVLGKTIKYGVADSETKPNTAVQAAKRFIHENKAMMVTGSVSSAVAIALEKACNVERTIFLAAISGSNETTGKDCQRYGFRLCYYAYSAAKAISPVLIKNIGKDKKAAYLVPDYTYGHTTYDSVSEFTGKDGGWKVVSQQVHPLGATDYSSYLINIANSGAEVLVVIDYGLDAVNSIKQASQFGLLKKMTLVVPYMSPFLGEELGPDIMQGVYGATGFWWTLQDKYEIAKDFVAAFEKKYKMKPHDSAYIAWLNLMLWADANERAGTFHPAKVVMANEKDQKRQGPVGEVWFRGADHQGVVNFPIVRGKKPSDMKSKEDLFDIVAVVNGAEAVAPVGHFGCKLGSYA